MKNTISPTILILISLALLAGLGLGYLFFHSSEKENPPSSGEHVHKTASETIWTCSMHPQIRQGEPGDCPICGMDLIPLGENSSSDPLVLEMTPEAVKLANIETTVIGAGGKAAKALSLSGKIQVDERLSASQVVHIPGRIEELFVSFKGEQVQKGQKVARLYAPELVAAQQELLEALKLKDSYPELLTAARQKLAFWKISETQIAEIEKNDKIQESFILKADESGIVTKRRVAVGDYVKRGEILFDMVNMNRLWVIFDAYEEDLAHVKVGDKVAFTTPAQPEVSFSTRITFIDPVIDPQTRVASLRGEIQNRNGLLKPEMFVRGSLQSLSKQTESLIVPKSAVLWTGKRSVVYVKVPDASVPSYRYQEISLGERMGDSYRVAEGLKAGDEVVTYGSFSIDAAAQLNNQASMINGSVVNQGEGQSRQLPDYTSTTPMAFKEQLDGVSRAYLALKDALVATDPELAGKEAAAFLSALSSVEMGLIQGASHQYWMKQLEALQTHGKKINTLSEVEAQREQFEFLSQAMIQSIKALGVPSDTYYVQYCPMAFDFDGAEWLSDSDEIRNPYFGDKMLTCGSVEDTITKDFRNPAEEASSNPASPQHNH